MKQCQNSQRYYFNKNFDRVCDGCIHNLSSEKGMSGTYGNENNLNPYKNLQLERKYYGSKA